MTDLAANPKHMFHVSNSHKNFATTSASLIDPKRDKQAGFNEFILVYKKISIIPNLKTYL